MIARVRIAPVEQWCEQAKAGHYEPRIVGFHVEVFTGEVLTAEQLQPQVVFRQSCDGRYWQMTARTAKLLTGRSVSNGWICEHMLEMD